MKTTDVAHLGSDDLAGCLLVQIESGAVHLLDFVLAQVTRLRAVEEPGAGAGSATLRSDGEAVPILSLGPVVVGLPLIMLLQVRSDAVQTVRQTTPVVSIRRLPPGDTTPTEAGRHGPSRAAELPEAAPGPGTEGQ